jgi:glutamyl-tRNA synthetase
MAASALAPRIASALVAAGLTTQPELTSRTEWFDTLIDLLKIRSRTTDDIVRQAAPYFVERLEYDPAAMATAWKDRNAAGSLLAAARASLAESPSWDVASLEQHLRGLAESQGVGAGKIFQPLRVALTGAAASPGIFDVLVLLGRERSLARIDAALRFLGTV